MKSTAIFTPDWLKKSAIYQINPRTFSKEGTISAVKEELEALKALGFSIMYLCPVFEEDASADKGNWSTRQKASQMENPKNPYRIKNYFFVDDEYGTDNDLREFVSVAHSLNMRVLLDLVYMHIGPNADILKTHPEFARQNDDGSFICTDYNFPYLDFNCEGLREYLWCNMVYFVSVFDVDGFRCDVGDAVPDSFWREGGRRIRAVKPDAVLINEGRAFSRLCTSFNACYHYDWHERLYSLFGGRLSLCDFVKAEKDVLSKLPANGLLLRDIDNHDTVTDWEYRVEALAGHDGMELIEALNYCFAGIPMVYCGNELADSSKLNMFANRFYMGKFEVTDRSKLKTEEYSLRRQEVIRSLNALKAEKEALQNAALEWLENERGDKIISFKRKGDKSSIIFIGNMSRENVSLNNFDLRNFDILMYNNCDINAGLAFKPCGYIIAEVQNG